MNLRQIMTKPVIRVHPEETVSVAARMLARENIGALPVCGSDGRLRGVLTDRDIVTRCLAQGRDPERTKVSQVMTARVVTAPGDVTTAAAAAVMAREQIRRLPVVENGRLCGMVSLADLAVQQESAAQAADALSGISSWLSSRE